MAQIQRPAAVSSRRGALLLGIVAFAPLIALLIYHGFIYNWLCDDAYISFRYVRNLLGGHGLVFNPGEHVEGYTNFLWVVNLAAVWGLFGIEPQAGSRILSILYTAGTLAVCLGLLRSAPFPGRRIALAWAVLLLLALNRTFAVWATSGLETRQFTFFVLLSIWLLRGYAAHARRLWLASLALGLAEFARPEGLLIGGMAIVWYALDAVPQHRFSWRGLLALIAPFAVLVGGHFVFRWLYYGDLLPNTYYAKHVRPWPDAGLAYVVVAGLENGLPVLLPAAVLGAFARLHRTGDSVYALAALCIFPHMLYLVRIGGDHFEYRPLDFYWPLLAVAAVEGVFWAAHGAERLAVRLRLEIHTIVRRAAVAVGVALLALYGTVLQFGKYCLTYEFDGETPPRLLAEGITRDNFPAAFLLPGMGRLVPVYNAALKQCTSHGIAATQCEFRAVWQRWHGWWAPYEVLIGQGVFPPDAVSATPAAGIKPYFLADLAFIDEHGLTDRHVARLPTGTPNAQRLIAHDRVAPHDYLYERGWNIQVYPALRARAGLRYRPDTGRTPQQWAPLWLRLSDDLLMPLEVRGAAWATWTFAGRDVLAWRAVRVLGAFEREGDTDGWTLRGAAFAGNPREASDWLAGFVGRGLLNSWHPDLLDAATGTARSPVFTAEPGQFLSFCVGGGNTDQVGVALLVDDAVVRTWRGNNDQTLRPVTLDLTPHVGRTLQIEVFDRSTTGWGHIFADHFVLVALAPAFENAAPE